MTTDHQLSTEHLSLGYGARQIVSDLSVSIPPGKVTIIIGANACGKSTLLKGLGRLLPPRSGAVYLDGRSISELPTREVARLVGILPQSPTAPESITVADLVGRGRYPHQGWLRTWSSEDTEAVATALTATDTLELAERSVDELSGGQRQRVWIAMALAQSTDVLLLDEPTTFLDINHQIEVLDLLSDLNRKSGKTIVMVLHDLNLAARYADQVIAMKNGAVVAQGAPYDVVTAEIVEEVFGLEAHIIEDPVSGTPLVLPVSRHRVAVPA